MFAVCFAEFIASLPEVISKEIAVSLRDHFGELEVGVGRE
jgi:hypothetical protein